MRRRRQGQTENKWVYRVVALLFIGMNLFGIISTEADPPWPTNRTATRYSQAGEEGFVGAAASNLLTPYLLETQGAMVAFGLPGVLMALATFVFWLGRNKFVHVPPAGFERFKEDTFSADGLKALKNLSPLFLLFVPMF